MPWRNWSVLIVLVLANYVVFSIIGTLLFPVTPLAAPTHVAHPTFTPGGQMLQRVEPLTYEFLTPSPTLTATYTPTVTGTPLTSTPMPKSTVIPTGASTPVSTKSP